MLRQFSHGTPRLSILIITPVPPGLSADGSMEKPVSMGGAATVSVLRAPSPLQTELDTGQFWPGRPVLPSCLTAFSWLLLVCGFGWEVPGVFPLSITSMFSVLPRQYSVVGSAVLFFSPLSTPNC